MQIRVVDLAQQLSILENDQFLVNIACLDHVDATELLRSINFSARSRIGFHASNVAYLINPILPPNTAYGVQHRGRHRQTKISTACLANQQAAAICMCELI